MSMTQGLTPFLIFVSRSMRCERNLRQRYRLVGDQVGPAGGEEEDRLCFAVRRGQRDQGAGERPETVRGRDGHGIMRSASGAEVVARQQRLPGAPVVPRRVRYRGGAE